jgi:N-acetylmuramoyl-L-alanine amidase
MPSYKTSGTLFVAATLFAIMFHSSCLANITVKRDAMADTVLPSTTAGGSVYTPFRALCEVLGFNCRWAKTAQKLTCVKDNAKIVISEDLPFYYYNDSIRQLLCSPVREASGLCLPAWLSVSVLGGMVKERLDWNPLDSTITFGAALAVAADTSVKQNKELEKTPEAPAPPSERQLVKNIVIDPGHGGKDPGALGQDGAKEKDLVLSVGLKLRDQLKKKSNFQST